MSTVSRWLCGKLPLGEAAAYRVNHALRDLGLADAAALLSESFPDSGEEAEEGQRDE